MDTAANDYPIAQLDQPADGRERTVLFATSHFDKAIWEPVVQRLPPWLNHVEFEGDGAASGRKPLRAEVSDEGLRIWYDSRELALSSVAAALYLRPNLAYPTDDRWADYLSREQARDLLFQTLWQAVPSDAWLNHPTKMRALGGLLGQLAVAQRAGFPVPRTLGTSDTSDVAVVFPNGAVHKRTPQIIFGADGARITQASFVKDPTRLSPEDTDPLTSYWQQRIGGRPWQAMAIGDRVFSAFWQQERHSPIVRYVVAPLPQIVQERCLNYLRLAELGMGSFSLIERGGQISCVGFDPYGHPGWMDKDLKLPIYQTIAKQLTLIALRH